MLIRLFVILTGMVPSLVMATSINDPIIQALNDQNSSTIKLFTPQSTDLSMSFLRMIFGSVGNVVHGSSSQLVGQMFAIFNMGVLAITGMLIAYTVVMATISSSQDSSPMGNKMSPFVVLRIVVGSSMLVPVFAGYSAIQVATMWFVVQGVGFADTVWNTALDYIQGTGGALMPIEYNTTSSTSDGTSMSEYTEIQTTLLGLGGEGKVTPATKGAKVSDFFLSAVCARNMYQINVNTQLSANTVQNIPPSSSRYGASFGSDCPTTGTGPTDVCFGDTQASGKKDAALCGAYTWGTSETEGDKSLFPIYSQAATRQMVYDVQSAASDLYTLAYNAFRNPETVPPATAASDAVTCSTKNNAFFACEGANVMLSAATDFYVLTKPPRIQAAQNQCDANTDWMGESEKLGWISAGNYYRDLVGAEDSFCSKSGSLAPLTHTGANALVPTVVKPVPSELSSSVPCEACRAVYQAIQTATLGTETETGSGYIGIARSIVEQMKTADQPFQSMSADVSIGDTKVTSLDFIAAQMYSILIANQTYDIPSFRPSPGFGVSNLNFASINMMTMINMVMGKLTGLLVYQTDTGTKSWVSSESGFKNAHHYLNNTCNQSAACDPTSPNSCFTKLKENYKACLQPNGIGMLAAIAVEEAGGRVDPLATLKDVGQTMINSAVLYWQATISQLFDTMQKLATNVTMALVGMGIGTGLLAGAASMIPIVGGAAAGVVQSAASAGMAAIQIFFDLDKAAMTMYLPIGGAISTFVFVQGVMLGLYVPFLPFLLFLFGAIGWLIAVVEAMIAAPLVAMGLTHPEGHDLLGKAEQSVMLFLGIFIRPAAMILGFIMSIILAYIAFRLLNLGFLHILAGYLQPFTTPTTAKSTALIGCVGLMLVYTFISMSLVEQVFAMIYVVPEKILRWIGGPADGTAQQIQQLSGAVKQQTQGAAQAAGQGASGAASQAPQINAQQGSTPKFDFGGSESGGGQKSAGEDAAEEGGAEGGGGPPAGGGIGGGAVPPP